MQNAIRYAEDLGYFKSRQCKGTMIADKNNPELSQKALSKRIQLVLELKIHN